MTLIFIKLSNCINKEYHVQEQLKLVAQRIEEKKLGTDNKDKPLRFEIKIQKPPQRPKTPTVTGK